MNAGSFRKGEKRPNQGKRGPNKATLEFKESVALLLAHGGPKMVEWLESVADGTHDGKPDPGRALDLIAKLAEYAAPKLARTELSGDVTIRSLSQELAALNGENPD
jgi:hypothetical protein